jgi:hypothetical protein
MSQEFKRCLPGASDLDLAVVTFFPLDFLASISNYNQDRGQAEPELALITINLPLLHLALPLF